MDALQSLVTDLNTLIPILNHWLHLSAAVIWVGGLAFLIMAVTPGLKKAVAKEQIKPITDAFYQHYKKVAGILLRRSTDLPVASISTTSIRSSLRKPAAGSSTMRST